MPPNTSGLSVNLVCLVVVSAGRVPELTVLATVDAPC